MTKYLRTQIYIDHMAVRLPVTVSDYLPKNTLAAASPFLRVKNMVLPLCRIPQHTPLNLKYQSTLT